MLARLRHHTFASVHTQDHRIESAGARHHRADQRLVPGHVHQIAAPAARQHERGEPQDERHAARLLLVQPIRIRAGQRFHERGLAVIDVPGSADGHGPELDNPIRRCGAGSRLMRRRGAGRSGALRHGSVSNAGVDSAQGVGVRSRTVCGVELSQAPMRAQHGHQDWSPSSPSSATWETGSRPSSGRAGRGGQSTRAHAPGDCDVRAADRPDARESRRRGIGRVMAWVAVWAARHGSVTWVGLATLVGLLGLYTWLAVFLNVAVLAGHP